MPTRDLREKYGDSRNGRNLINKAIRAEMVGGDHCLLALDALDQLKQKWLARGWTDNLAEIEAALEAVRAIHASMRAEIRIRYQMPPED